MSTLLHRRPAFDSLFSSSRMIPIHTDSPGSQHMSPVSSAMGPPSNNSHEVDQRLEGMNGNSPQHGREQSQMGAAAAVSAAQGPKVVQTAFIHKLYSMLEDKTIEHLISWSNNGDSFVMSPSNEFSKVLAQYFKHTNISSFVRQLNMYGFHKVSDVFHTSSSESALWEFKHGNGNFKKGDLLGLREIKRRASRHTLIHRDSFTQQPPKPGPMQSGPPPETMPEPEQRLAYLESMLHDVYTRLSRTEDSSAVMATRCQNLTDSLGKCHHWLRQLSQTMHTALPADSILRSDLVTMQKEIDRHQEQLREMENTMAQRPSYYSTSMSIEPPVSPRGWFSDSRRSSMQMEPPPSFGARPPVPPMPPQFTSPTPRRFGSISATHTSPGFSKPTLPTPPQPHPLSNVSEPPPGLARRHTSADIREHWPPNAGLNSSPFASGVNSVNWQPSSPNVGPDAGGGDQALQNQLANYQINGASRRTTITPADHMDALPPAHRSEESAQQAGLGLANASWGVGASKFPRPNFDLHSAPATRRSSMVHSLLNPADTAEQDNEDDGGPLDDRKRKRMI